MTAQVCQIQNTGKKMLLQDPSTQHYYTNLMSHLQQQLLQKNGQKLGRLRVLS